MQHFPCNISHATSPARGRVTRSSHELRLNDVDRWHGRPAGRLYIAEKTRRTHEAHCQVANHSDRGSEQTCKMRIDPSRKHII